MKEGKCRKGSVWMKGGTFGRPSKVRVTRCPSSTLLGGGRSIMTQEEREKERKQTEEEIN